VTVRNANKSPKMHYFTVVWEVEKRSISTGPYRHQKLINSSTWWWASDNINADYFCSNPTDIQIRKTDTQTGLITYFGGRGNKN